MMKKNRIVFFLPALLFGLAGCLSSGKAALLAEREPVALVSVACNQEIIWKDEMPASSGSAARRAIEADADLTLVSYAGDFIVTVEQLVRDAVNSSGLISLADKDTVLSSGAYREAGISRTQTTRKLICPPGFALVDYRDKNFASALAAETGIKRSMFVEFNFVKFMAGGIGRNGKCRAEVSMSVIILDAGGKILYVRDYLLESWEPVEVSRGVYSQSALMTALENSVVDICNEFLDDLKY